MIDVIFIKKDKKYSLYGDYEMRILDYDIETPKLISDYVQIPYSNKIVDLTEVFGMSYEQRNIIINVDVLNRTLEYHTYINDLINSFHGQKVKLIITSDCDYYYEGRLSINPEKRDNNYVGKVKIEMLANPLKVNIETGEECI